MVGTSICYVNPTVTLKMRSRSPKHNLLIRQIWWNSICWFKRYRGYKTLSRQRRHGHDTDVDTNGIRTETNIPLLTFGGVGDINISNGFDFTERTRVCGRNGNFKCSKGNNSQSMQSRVTVPLLCTSSHGVYHLCEVS